jgi:hypothetical protein
MSQQMPPLKMKQKYQLRVTTFCQSHGGKEESYVFNV